MTTITILTTDFPLRRAFARQLSGDGHQVSIAATPDSALELAERKSVDLVVADPSPARPDSSSFCDWLRRIVTHVPVVAIVPRGEIGTVAAALSAGAADYLRQPADTAEVSLVVNRCLAQALMLRELAEHRQRALGLASAAEMLGHSPAVVGLRASVHRVAGLVKRDGKGPHVVVCGERGSGKRQVASLLHRLSPRAAAPFVEIDCQSVSEAFLEAELFGYEAAAFADAAAARAGILEAAADGTVVLRNVDRLPGRIQAKLDAALRDDEIVRVGATRRLRLRSTIVATTEIDLQDAATAGDFLVELSDRLGVMRLKVPPLRERGDDVTLLAKHFARNCSTAPDHRPRRLTRDALKALQGYHWPGNVRELRSVVDWAIRFGSRRVIALDDLALDLDGTALSSATFDLVRSLQVDFTNGAIPLNEIEAHLIHAALDFTDGNETQSAKLLGISRHVLRYRLERHSATSASREPTLRSEPPQ